PRAGPMLARVGRRSRPPRAGHVLGRRRLEPHLPAFARLGVEVALNYISELRAERLVGTRIFLDEASVMGTENTIMAAVLAAGETTLTNAAREPHVQDLCRFLVSLRAPIEGIRPHTRPTQGGDARRGRGRPPPP